MTEVKTGKGFEVAASSGAKCESRQENAQSRQKLGKVQVGFLSIGQAAKRFNIPERTLRNWCETGKIASVSKPYGQKMTYQVVPQAVELMLKSLQEEVQAQKLKKRQAIKHKELIEPWITAMANGLMTGKAFSPLTITYYRAYAREILDKHTVLSMDNFKKELMSIPPSAFAKRYKLYKAIVCFAKFLVREEQLDSSFLIEVKPLFPKRHTPPKRQTVDEAGLKKLLEACKGYSDRLIVILLSQTGLRVSEACALRLDDLDLDKGVLTVRMGKGGKARKVGLSTGTIEAVKDYLSTRSGLEPNHSLFLNKEGQPQTRHGLGRRLEKIGKSAGVKVSPHALRRSFVTINANKGRSLVMLQMACGHSDITTTRNYCLTSELEVIEAMKGWN